MKIYAVMVDSYNGEYEVTSVFAVYAKEEDANNIVSLMMSGKRGSAISAKYYVEDFDVIGAVS